MTFPLSLLPHPKTLRLDEETTLRTNTVGLQSDTGCRAGMDTAPPVLAPFLHLGLSKCFYNDEGASKSSSLDTGGDVHPLLFSAE